MLSLSPELRGLAELVGELYDCPDYLDTTSRVPYYIRPRHAFRYGAYLILNSKSEVAKLIGNNHATVINAIKKFEFDAEKNDEAFKYKQLISEYANSIEPKTRITAQRDDLDKLFRFKTVYIAGQVTGLDYEVAKRRFKQLETLIKRYAEKVINPIELCEYANVREWNKCMQICLGHLTDADVVVAMPNYIFSKGAMLEVTLARDVYGKKFYVADRRAYEYIDVSVSQSNKK